jgi:hypothetical protein
MGCTLADLRRSKEDIMIEYQLVLSEDEHKYLTNLLEDNLKQVMVEEHRTRTTYRDVVRQQERLVQSVLNKLRTLAPAGSGK